MRRRNPTWTHRRTRPFTPAEDQELCQMVRCGLSIEFYKDNLPGRSFGEIIARRLDLIKAGAVQMARRI
ncbi:MAG: hypothetical protein B7Y36_08315 [Novosphingobium sp. 28-62-57]|uniref:hypothetical protein n=1 Tax=unclassified Novosphingobium TaxID=2644732 RepID=UPI000BD43A2B|nr:MULTISPECIES: hypothetical protein [unclassified Novosphingobium]OYW47927.1 MAG: hypothetical protein B7Z36_01405 [Novosphingobium sp. 12-63-9]OYZ10820.1 MAG: hypothetical protein B7Y36_08315 [Novosphingobium sp. 28-62-57]HQS70010.1 hypothetical protein [Novosphingobium sp.]